MRDWVYAALGFLALTVLVAAGYAACIYAYGFTDG